MLWTDTLFVSSSDLVTVDPDVKNTALAENIVLDGVNGVCARTIEKAGFDLLALNMTFSGIMVGGDVSYNHSAAVSQTGSNSSIQRPSIRLSNIVVNDNVNPQMWSALKRWVVYKSLAEVYSQAENSNQKVDRYTMKAHKFGRESRWNALIQLEKLGCPVVISPLPCPAAMFEYNTGSWSAGTAPTGFPAVGGSFVVGISYVDRNSYVSPKMTNNAESALSALQAVTVAPGNAISWDLTALNPPSSQSQQRESARAIISPLSANAYNVYVGTSAGSTMYLQNSFPIPITTLVGALNGDPNISGPGAGTVGQYANYNIAMPTMRDRS